MSTIDAFSPSPALPIGPSVGDDRSSSAGEPKPRFSGLSVEAALEYLDAEGLWAEIGAGRPKSLWLSNYSARIAAVCRSVAWPENQQIARHWLCCALFIMLVGIPFDYIAIPQAIMAILLGHGPLTVLAFAFAYRAWRDERSDHYQGLSSCLFAAAVMVAAAMTGSQAGGPNFERFIVLGFICMATGLALLPLTIRWRWLYAASLNGQFILWQILSPMADDATKWLFTFYCSSFVLACVLTRYVFDNRQIEMTILRLKEVRNSHLMKQMALTDALTGLRNRKAMMGEMATLLANAQPGTLLSVAMIDIDDFKRLNDTLGHAAGDEALKAVGSMFAEFSKASGAICGRIGGEEFLVLLPGADTDAATHELEGAMRQLERMNIPNPGSRVTNRVTLSIGLVTTTLGAASPSEEEILMRHADVALYESKNAGRNRITSLDPSALAPAAA